MYKHENSTLTILEAVETLSSIADMEFSRDVAIAAPDEIKNQNQMVTARILQWIKVEDQRSPEKLIKETFRVILSYLKDFYKNKYRGDGNHETIEGVKTIMVLAGEAAKKIDRYTTLFKQTKDKCVVEMKEYRQLQEFYLNRIARRIDESVLSKWIFELTKRAMIRREEIKFESIKPISTSHVFIDLESVKKDTEYELFFLHKEDGSKFFNPRLIRNIKLICDFGKTLIGEKEVDPFERIQWWYDRAMQTAARDIINVLGSLLDRYIHEARSRSKKEVIGELNKAVIALMMASNPKNHLSNNPIKCCREYFQDFLFFLRSALQSDQYQKMIVYSPKKTAGSASSCELDIMHALCRALFTSIQEHKEVVQSFEHIFNEAVEHQSAEHQTAAKASQTFWSRLAATYTAMTKLMKSHPNGSLIKVLEVLQQGIYHAYDPIGQFNIPNQLYSLYSQETKITNVRIPCPVYQESINEAKILEEFKGFLRGYDKGRFHNKHLLINLQDRTSWREQSRCKILEQLQDVEEFSQNLVVVTLAKDTEFYNQFSPYDEDNQAKSFIKHFKEHLREERCGYYFPEVIYKQLFPKFIDEMIDAVHRVFFSHKNVLSKEDRLDFIEIFYLFLQLKLIELVHPETFSLVCKDGVDIGGTASAQLYAFLKLIHGDLAESSIERLNLILYAAPLLVRERIVIPERFNRMLNTLKKIESTRRELGETAFPKMIHQAFGKFFKTPFFKV